MRTLLALSATLVLVGSTTHATATEQPRDDVRAHSQLVDKHVGVQLHMASFMLGRVGGDLMWIVDGGHAVTAGGYGTPFRASTLWDVYNAYGGEVGYRYYFAGRPLGVFAALAANVSRLRVASLGTEKTFTRLSPSVDLGWQWTNEQGAFLAATVGAQYNLGSRESLADLPDLIVGNGVRPRVTLTVGALF